MARGFGSRTLSMFSLMAAAAIAQRAQPAVGEAPKQSNKRKRQMFSAMRSFFGSNWRPPHQGHREMLRRRMGGFYQLRRMEKLGFYWDDQVGIYQATERVGAK